MTTEPVSYSKLFRLREYRWLLIAHIGSISGDILTKVALATLVYSQTRSPLLTAVTYAFGFLPHVLSIAFLGAIADYVRPRKLLVTGDLARFVTVMLMAVPGVPTAMLLLLVFLSGSVAPVFRASRAALLPEITPDHIYVLARSMFTIVTQAAQIGGFALGGVLLLFVSPRAILIVDAITFGVSALLIYAFVNDRPAPAAIESTRQDRPTRAPAPRRMSPPRTTRIAVLPLIAHSARMTFDGNRALLSDARIVRLLLLLWVPPALLAVPEGLAAPLAASFTAGTDAIGFILASAPIGMLLGDVVVGRFITDTKTRTRTVAPLSLASVIALAAVGMQSNLMSTIMLLGVAGFGTSYVLSVDYQFVQAVPVNLRGRAMAVAGSGLMLAQGIAILLAGVLAESFSPHAVTTIGGVLGIAIICALTPWRALGASQQVRQEG